MVFDGGLLGVRFAIDMSQGCIKRQTRPGLSPLGIECQLLNLPSTAFYL
jgi:hypothetical protein